MAPRERFTYFGYSEGLDPKLLRLGTLAFDYANPRTKRPYIHREDRELLDDSPLVTKDARPLCSMMHTRDKSLVFKLGLEGLLEFETSQSGIDSCLVVGRDGSKLELIDPDAFFQEKLLSEEAARVWLQTRLSVANKFRAIYKNMTGAPKIWLLTGIYLMEDAIAYSIVSKSSSNSVSVSVPVPEPTGTAALLGVTIGTKLNLADGVEAQAFTQILGRRVWAAQWRLVDAKYVYGSAQGHQRLQLLDVWSPGTSRGHSGDTAITEAAEVTLGGQEEPSSLDGQGGVEEYDDLTWLKFEEEVDNLLEDLED